MNSKQAIQVLTPLMWRIGKSNGEQLWMHQYTVWHIFVKLCNVGALPRLSSDEQESLEVACLLHDLKKSAPWNQLILRGERDTEKICQCLTQWWEGKGDPLSKKELAGKKRLFANGKTDHQIEDERDFKYFLKPYLERIEKEKVLPFELTEDSARPLFDIAKHHFLRDEDISNSSLPGFGKYIKILKYCDHLASMETLDVDTINEMRSLNLLGRRLFDLSYFTISREFGPTTALLLETVSQAYKEADWHLLLYLENGALYVKRDEGQGNLPDKTTIVGECYKSFLQESLAFVPLQTGTKTMLTGLAANHPARFLESHKDELLRTLDTEDAGLSFFKTLVDILVNGGYRNDNVRSNRPVLDILFGLTGGTRGINVAAAKWQSLGRGDVPRKADGKADKRPALKFIFNHVAAEEAIPPDIELENTLASGPLKDKSAEDLFSLLVEVANKCEDESERDAKLKQYLDDTISMEEEKDFHVIALRQFEEYKNYKARPTQEDRGTCEICGCIVVQKPGADFARGQIQAFSQIKARPDVPRKVCVCCAYDNSVFRQGLGPDYVPIYARIHSKVPLSPLRSELKNIIQALKGATVRRQELGNMQKRWGILFPDVPILVGEDSYEPQELISTEDGMETVFRLESLDKKNFSPKDQKAKYRPLYHLLHLMGLRVSIGTEEQLGLFGEEMITTRDAYLRSLASTILATTFDRKRKFLFADNLLEQSPGVAVMFAAEEQRSKGKSDKRFLKLRKDLAPKFFEYLSKSGIIVCQISKGGEYRMKDLLKDAAFFAEGVPKFCWTQDERERWNNPNRRSKHLIVKPVSQALNEMVQGKQGEGLDAAIAKFLSNIREDIAHNKDAAGTVTDVSELQEFVEGVKERFARYFVMKTNDITNFIKVKNALLSAMFVLKRYENLKEVVCND